MTCTPTVFLKVLGSGEGDGAKRGLGLNAALSGGPAPARGLENFIGGGTAVAKSLTVSLATIWVSAFDSGTFGAYLIMLII